MDSFNRFGSSLGVITVGVFECGTIHAFTAVNDLTELWRELLISGVSGRPQGVAAVCWDLIVMQVSLITRLSIDSSTAPLDSHLRYAGRLFLVHHIGVPVLGAEWVAEVERTQCQRHLWPAHRDNVQPLRINHMTIC